MQLLLAISVFHVLEMCGEHLSTHHDWCEKYGHECHDCHTNGFENSISSYRHESNSKYIAHLEYDAITINEVRYDVMRKEYQPCIIMWFVKVLRSLQSILMPWEIHLRVQVHAAQAQVHSTSATSVNTMVPLPQKRLGGPGKVQIEEDAYENVKYLITTTKYATSNYMIIEQKWKMLGSSNSRWGRECSVQDNAHQLHSK